MTFINPYFLLLIPAALAAAWIAFSLDKTKTAPLKFPSPLGLKAPRTLRTLISRILPYVTRPAALILIALALARPQYIFQRSLPPAQGVDILMCIDTSTSMRALDFDPFNRLEAAKKAAREFIEKRKNDRIGVVVFAAYALLQCPLTLDYGSLLEFLEDVSIGMTHSDGTAIGDAIAVCTNHLKNSPAKSKVIILLTDGRSNTGIISDPVLAAKAAAAYGIKIYTIGTAGTGPAKIPVDHPLFGRQYAMQKEDLDVGTLMAISATAAGEFFRAKNYSELQNIYKKIDSLEKTEFKDPVRLNYNDKYLFFLLPALFLIFIEFVSAGTVLMKIP